MDSTLKEKAASLRKEHILAAAATVFAKQGFRRTTVREIALEAGVADGTIYNVFKDKEALLFGLLSPLETAASEQALPPLEGDPVTILTKMIERRWDGYTPGTMAMLRVVLSEALVHPELRQAFLDRVIAPPILKAAPVLASVLGSPLEKQSSPLVAPTIMSMIFGALVLRLLGDKALEDNADHVPALMARMIVRGLGPDHKKESGK